VRINPKAARRPLVGTGVAFGRIGAAFSGGPQQVRLPDKGDAVCLVGGEEQPPLRAGGQYTVIEFDFMEVWLTDAATGHELGPVIPDLLAPAVEVAELLALHYALYLACEAGVVCAVLEAYREASSEGEE